MSDYPMLISNKLHSFRNFLQQSLKVKIICHAPHGLENELCRMRISIYIR